MDISVEKAKEIREQIGATHLVLFVQDASGEQNVTTHGQTEEQAHVAATLGNMLKQIMGWPFELCHAKPQQRAEWQRKTRPEILQRIAELKQQREAYQDQRSEMNVNPDTEEDHEALYVSVRQCDFAIEQLEWVLNYSE